MGQDQVGGATVLDPGLEMDSGCLAPRLAPESMVLETRHPNLERPFRENFDCPSCQVSPYLVQASDNSVLPNLRSLFA